MTSKSEDQILADGRRVREFLADPAVNEAFEALSERYVASLRDATEPEKVLQLHAKLRVVEDIKRTLRIIADAGTTVEVQRANQARRQQRPR